MKKFLFIVFTLIILQERDLFSALGGLSYVYLTNNTGLSFDIEIAQTSGEALLRGDQLTGEQRREVPYGWSIAWKENSVRPQSSQLLYSINRGGTAIHKGKEYGFTTTLRKDASSVGIHQMVEGTLFGSNMVNSLGGLDLSETLFNTTETGKRHTIWHSPAGDICITYDRYFAIGYDDLSITLDYTPCKW